jgi:hypothetical protein
MGLTRLAELYCQTQCTRTHVTGKPRASRKCMGPVAFASLFCMCIDRRSVCDVACEGGTTLYVSDASVIAEAPCTPLLSLLPS